MKKAAIALVLVAFAVPAEAHLVTTGLGPFYDGISHLVLTPEDLLSVLALALLAGFSGVRSGRALLFFLPGAWLGAGLFGLTRPVEALAPVLTATALFALGVLVALGRRLPLSLVVALGIGVGALHGYLNGTALSGTGAGALGLAGVGATIFVLVALLAAFVASLRSPWALVALRVAGSWIAAISMLMLGWTLGGG